MSPDSSLEKLKAWALPIALGALNVLLTNQINTAANEIKDTRKDIVELTGTVRVQTAQMEYLTQRVTNLEGAKAEANALIRTLEERLNSLEQRAALHDEWINAHK